MIFGICCARDEVDVIGATVRHHLAELDAVIVEDHRSVDGTLDVLRSISDVRLVVGEDRSERWDQAETMNRLASVAEHSGATWVVPFDADEVWCSPHGRLRDVLPTVRADVCIATVYEHVPRPDDIGPDPLRRMVHRRVRPWDWSKVAIRTGRGLRLSLGQHEATGDVRSVDRDTVQVRHFPWRSPAQVRARHRRNAITAFVGAGFDAHVRNHRGLDELDEATFAEWWSGMTDLYGTVLDPAPVRS